MPTCESSQDCTLPCQWEDQEKCLRKLVAESLIRHGSLSHGQLVGLRHLYQPLPLPPCVTVHGRIHYQPIPEEEETQPLARHGCDDTPDL